METPGLGGVFSESWQNCAFVKREIKVEELSDEQVVSPKNPTSYDVNIPSITKKKRLQPELVVSIGRLPIVKVEKDINIQSNDQSSDGEDNLYHIEESHNEVNFSVKTCIKSEPSTTDSIKEESVCEFENSKCNDQTIKEEHFGEAAGVVVQEEIDIKVEDEGKDQPNPKSAIGLVKKGHHPSNKTGPLSGINRISTNNRHLHLTEPPVFKCLNCTYQTHRKLNISRHVLSHMERSFECPHCPYKTYQERIIKHHLLIHVPKDDANLHRCPHCSYTSVRKSAITHHMLKHKTPDEAIWYQCPECPYKTKRRGNLTHQHMLIHKKDVPVHKCTLCSYESIRKEKLQRHMQHVHRPKDIQLIHCQEKGCSFKTHDEAYLARHIRVLHKCQQFFNCSKCSYQTKYAKSFRAHELRHETSDKWFSCQLCPYKAPSISLLKGHMLVHETGSDVKWFYCSDCSFKTKRRYTLKLHKLTHNANSEKMFECSECPFTTPVAPSFRIHLLKHQDPDSKGWFRCPQCPYKAILKARLKQHLKIHRSEDEIEWLKCSKCPYKTHTKHSLKSHQLVHRKPKDMCKWFHCFLCTWRTSRKCTLVRHIGKMHRDSDGRLSSELWTDVRRSSVKL